MFGTGAGITVLIAAGLGMLVRIVVVAQTIYAATVDHLKEYGTLKAIGAANRYLSRHHAAGDGERRSRLRRRHRDRDCRLAGKPAGHDRDPAAVAAARRAWSCDGGHVSHRLDRLDQQGHQDRSSDGLQELTMTFSTKPSGIIVEQVTKSCGSGATATHALKGVDLDVRRRKCC